MLASAVNRPIILLEGSERLNAVRLDRWRYLTEVRARTCAEQLIPDEATQKQVLFDLVAMAGGPPDPKIKPRLQEALDRYAPDARRARAGQSRHPRQRADAVGALRHARGDEAGLRLRLARPRARRHDHLRRRRQPGASSARRRRGLPSSMPSTLAGSIRATRSIPPRSPPSARARASSSRPPTRKGGSCAISSRARRRPISARRSRAMPRRDSTRRGAKAAWSPPRARSSRRSPSPTPCATPRRRSTSTANRLRAGSRRAGTEPSGTDARRWSRLRARSTIRS